MSELSKRSTVYFSPEFHHALKNKEDQEDLSAFEERANEPNISYEELFKNLKSHGKL